MFNHSTQQKQPKTSFDGMYRGLVVNNNDPEFYGRVKIRVIGVFDDIEDSILPWAEYADPMMGGQSGFGAFIIPDVGSYVWCFFENGNHMNPVYFAGAPAKPHLPPERLEADHPESRGNPEYPKNRVWRTQSGHTLEFDDTPDNEKIRISHKSGTQTVMFANGDVYERVVGNVKRVVLGNVEETINGNFVTTIVGTRTEQSGNGSSYLSSANIDINAVTIFLN